jgi:hypothetical protein
MHEGGARATNSHVSCLIIDDREVQNDFATVYQTDRIRWKGHDEVTRVLDVLVEHIRF